MTLRRNEGPHPSSYATSGTSVSAFSSPLPVHNGFSTRTRLRPGGPQSQSSQQQSSQQSTISTFHDNPTNNSAIAAAGRTFRGGFIEDRAVVKDHS